MSSYKIMTFKDNGEDMVFKMDGPHKLKILEIGSQSYYNLTEIYPVTLEEKRKSVRVRAETVDIEIEKGKIIDYEK